MEITSALWKSIARLKPTGVKIGKGNTIALENFNKVQFFKRCSRNPNAAMRGFHVR